MTGLPKGWVKTPISEVVEFNPKHDSSIASDTEISFVPMPAVSEHTGEIVSGEPRKASSVIKGYTHFQNGDVLFAKITPCMENGKAAVARSLLNGLGCGSTEFHVMRSEGAVDATFLWRFIRQKSFRSEAERVMTGAVGQRRVPTDFLKSYSFPLPPLAEQRRIVAKLDSLDASSKRARADLDRIHALVARAKQAILEKAFSSAGLTTELRSFTASLDQGWSPKCEKLPAATDDDWAVMTTTAIQAMRFDGGENKALPSTLSPKPNLEVLAGDLLITRAGPRNRVGVVCAVERTRPRVMLCDKAYRLRFSKDVDAEYIAMMCNAPQAQEKIENMKTGGNDSGLNLTQSKFLSLELPLPKLAKQRALVGEIRYSFAKIDRIAAEAASASALLNRLDQALLSKAFRGELVPQDPADEPASELLARIQAARAAAPRAKRARRTKETP